MAFIYAITIAASQSFLTPIGYQTNLMVYGPSFYQFLDLTRYGSPLTIGLALIVLFLICRWFGLSIHSKCLDEQSELWAIRAKNCILEGTS